MSDETRLEDAFRAGLQRRADDVDTTVDLLGPARSAARGRRRLAVTGSIGLVAAALVTAFVVQNTGGSDGPDGPRVVDEGPSDPLPTEWRTEAWHGVELEVPADWAWGSAPTGEQSIVCGEAGNGSAYVGRPVIASDACQTVEEPPRGDYVWFDDTITVGYTVDLGDGYVSQSVDVRGTKVNVTTNNQALSDHIIDSIRTPEGCAPSLPEPPSVDSMLTEGMRDPSSAQICAYQQGESSTWWLVYATTLNAKQTRTYHSQVYDGGHESSPDFCDDSTERVLITMTGKDFYGDTAVTQDTVVDPFCREVSGSPGMVSPLSDEGMEVWAVGGLPVTLYALIGPQG